MKSVFSDDRCVRENTSRPASVRVVRRRRTASALQQATAYSKKCEATFLKVLSSYSLIQAGSGHLVDQGVAYQNGDN